MPLVCDWQDFNCLECFRQNNSYGETWLILGDDTDEKKTF